MVENDLDVILSELFVAQTYLNDIAEHVDGEDEYITNIITDTHECLDTINTLLNNTHEAGGTIDED